MDNEQKQTVLQKRYADDHDIKAHEKMLCVCIC